jgi:hypothetical protein
MFRQLRNTALVPFKAVDEVDLSAASSLKGGSNLERYLKWRQHALELASFFALIATAIAILQVSTTLADLSASKEYCDVAYQPVGAVAAPTAAAGQRRLDVAAAAAAAAAADLAGRTRANFPSDGALSSNSSLSCASLKGTGGSPWFSLMEPERRAPHSMTLADGEVSNLLCGTFDSSGASRCVPELVVLQGCDEGEGCTKARAGSEDSECPGAQVSCGKVPDATKCAGETANFRAASHLCWKVTCRDVGTRCDADTRCAAAFFCGNDEHGAVCAQSEQECAAKPLFKRGKMVEASTRWVGARKTQRGRRRHVRRHPRLLH